MNKKDRLYWQGIAKHQNKPLTRSGRVKEYLEFLDQALNFVRKLKKKLSYENPTEIEFYKRWMSLSKR